MSIEQFFMKLILVIMLGITFACILPMTENLPRSKGAGRPNQTGREE